MSGGGKSSRGFKKPPKEKSEIPRVIRKRSDATSESKKSSPPKKDRNWGKREERLEDL